MDGSPARRRVLFAVIVCALVALGAYLIGPVAHSSGQPRGSSGTAAVSTRSPAVTPTAAAAAGSGQPDIYQWLPFTEAGLSAAASLVTRFCTAYGTYSYTQSAAAYGASLEPLASGQLVEQIKAAYSAPGVAATRAASRQVVTGAATIDSISAFGPTSLTFIVQLAQRITATTGTSEPSSAYAVTLTGSGTSWQVTNIELATVGNS